MFTTSIPVTVSHFLSMATDELHPSARVFPGIRNIAPLGVPMALCLGRPSVTVGACLPINHDPVQVRGNSRRQPLVHLESVNYACN